MKTYVTLSDYKAIKKCMTEEEIKEKYGYLEIMSQKEYRERKMEHRKKEVDEFEQQKNKKI